MNVAKKYIVTLNFLELKVEILEVVVWGCLPCIQATKEQQTNLGLLRQVHQSSCKI